MRMLARALVYAMCGVFVHRPRRTHKGVDDGVNITRGEGAGNMSAVCFPCRRSISIRKIKNILRFECVCVCACDRVAVCGRQCVCLNRSHAFLSVARCSYAEMFIFMSSRHRHRFNSISAKITIRSDAWDSTTHRQTVSARLRLCISWHNRPHARQLIGGEKNFHHPTPETIFWTHIVILAVFHAFDNEMEPRHIRVKRKSKWQLLFRANTVE